jgi:thiamine biosynthesis lipoprotein
MKTTQKKKKTQRLPIVVVTALAACTPPPAPAPAAPAPPPVEAVAGPTVVTLDGEAFSSNWHVAVVANTAVERARAQAIVPVIDAAIAEVGRQLSSWNAQSEVARFSAAQHLHPLSASAGTLQVVAVALDVAARTNGAFDPTVGPLLDLWGFSPSTKGKVSAPPTAAAIAAAQKRVGYAHVRIDGGLLIKDRVDTTLDVTALADGAAAAAIARSLQERGFGSFLVDVAGEVVVAGPGHHGKPWRVGINTPSPDADPQDTAQQVALTPAGASVLALSTSGTYRDTWSKDGTRYTHIIDPTTGVPVTHALVSCTIVGPDLVVADALSTACIVMGKGKTQQALPTFAGYEALFIEATTATTPTTPTTLTTTSTAGFPTLL